MSMTMSQKILAAHCGKELVQAGDLIRCQLDLVLANDITGPVAIGEFEKLGVDRVFDQEKIALVPDHFAPNKDIAAAKLTKRLRDFARKMNITNYFEVGRMGVEHALLPEQGLIHPGQLIIGADSHTCTYGALGAFSTGVGSTDMGMAMATGEAWFKVPEAMRFVIKGKKRKYVSGKDVILHIIGMVGVDGARYRSMEFVGDLQDLTMDDRFSMANMAIEAGAKNGIFQCDAVSQAYVDARSKQKGTVYMPDDDAEYISTYEIDLDTIPLTVAFPHLPENARSIEEAEAMDLAIDQVVIGSCTNGRIEDMEVAANILKNRTISPYLRCIIIPSTQEVWQTCVDKGWMDIFIESGAAVSTPTCGPCLGGHMGILAPSERCVATTNRNFVGRMGDPTSEVYLASPAVAAATAITGKLCGPDKI